jgi:hypothetical protein
MTGNRSSRSCEPGSAHRSCCRTIFSCGQLRADGGPGYTYLLTDFLRLLTAAGLDGEEVCGFVAANP